MRLMPSAATICALLALLLPATALAQDQSPSANDPEKDTPAGSVYELPLESAREDGAPRSPSGGGDAGSRSAGGDTASPIRSENRFGSSAKVPGVDSPREGKSADRADEANSQVATPVAAANGYDDDGGSGPSLALILLLVALLVVVGAGTGVLAARARRG